MRLQSYFSIFFINAQRRHNLLWPWIPLWKYWSYKDHTCPQQPLTFKIFSSLQILHLNNLSLKLLSSGVKNSRSQGEGEGRGRGGEGRETRNDGIDTWVIDLFGAVSYQRIHQLSYFTRIPQALDENHTQILPFKVNLLLNNSALQVEIHLLFCQELGKKKPSGKM